MKNILARVAKWFKAPDCNPGIVAGSNPALRSNLQYREYLDETNTDDYMTFVGSTEEECREICRKSKILFNKAIKETNKYIDYLNSLENRFFEDVAERNVPKRYQDVG